jgi:hypothetical protein
MGQIIIKKYVSELSGGVTGIVQPNQLAGNERATGEAHPGTGGIRSVEIICRKVHPYLISNNSTLTVQHGDAVLQRQILFELIFEKSKTGDIVQGLPKIEQLFEARRTSPHVLATIHGQLKAKYFGLVEDPGFLIPDSRLPAKQARGQQPQTVARAFASGFASWFASQQANQLANQQADQYGAQTGPLRELKAAKIALRFIQKILVDEIQFVYSSQGVEISDKHIEIIVRQMTSKVIISEKGNTSFYPDDIIEFQDIENFVLSKISQAVPCFAPDRSSLPLPLERRAKARANDPAQDSRNRIADWRHRESNSDFGELSELSTPFTANQNQVVEPGLLVAKQTNKPVKPPALANIGFTQSSQDEALKLNNYSLHPSTGHPGMEPAKPVKYPLDGGSLIEGLRFEPIVLGITKRAFLSESWASSASFQEAKKVLMEAALQSKVDFLFGLKSNLIVGRYIRAGTSFR